MPNYPSTFELPTQDKLTGLLTRHYFDHLLQESELPKAKENNEPLSFVLLDIDNFFQLNEAKGRNCGDVVLKGVAKCLREVMPEEALIARYGGDEFAVLLPQIHLDDAFTLAEKYRQEVAVRIFDEGECTGMQITSSIGVAGYPGDGNDHVELLRSGSHALHRAKANGRNRVSLPIRETRMITKTSHYTPIQLEKLSELSKRVKKTDATLLREALDDLFKKYDDKS
jgi:diguanylate cyclase (GGDEF)-like protein